MNRIFMKLVEAMCYQFCFVLATKFIRPLRRMFAASPVHVSGDNPGFDIIIPIYKVSLFMLRRTLNSVFLQDYHNWKLILTHTDFERPRVKRLLDHCKKNKKIILVKLSENLGISGNTNAALKHVSQDYIMFLDQDDRLERSALKIASTEAIKYHYPDILYSDEDKIIGYTGIHITPHYKPDWNPALLMTNNYISHITFFSKAVVQRTGYLCSDFDGSQDFDYILRATEFANQIVHIRKVLYHWRIHRTSTAKSSQAKSYTIQAGVRLLEDLLLRRQIHGSVSADLSYPGLYQIHFTTVNQPLVSLILVGCKKNTAEKINFLVDQIAYTNLEIIFASETTTIGDQSLFYLDPHIGDQAKGDYFVFLSPDLEPLTVNWLDDMVSYAENHDCGFVSPMLICNEQVVGPAIAIDRRGIINLFSGHSLSNKTDFARMKATQIVTAFNSGCLLISRHAYEQIGLLVDVPTPISVIVSCLILGKKNLPNIWLPDIIFNMSPSGSLYMEYGHKAMLLRHQLLNSKFKDLVYEEDPNYPQVFKIDGSYRLCWQHVYRSFL